MRKNIIIGILFVLSIVTTAVIAWNLSIKRVENQYGEAYDAMHATYGLIKENKYDDIYDFSLSSSYRERITKEDFRANFDGVLGSYDQESIETFTLYRATDHFLLSYQLSDSEGNNGAVVMIQAIEDSGSWQTNNIDIVKY